MFRAIRGSSGYTLIELVVAAGISSALFFASGKLILDSFGTGAAAEKAFWISARRVEFEGIIKSDQGWAAVLAANPNMACFGNSTSCAAFAAAPQGLIIPVNPTAGMTIDGGNPATGMDGKGDYCLTYSVAGNSRCPVGIQASWQALCDNAACLHAQPKIVIQFRNSDPAHPALNLGSQTLTIYKDARLETLNEVCTSMGGVLVGSNCTVASLNTACDSALGQFVVGFDAAGNVICDAPSPGSCAPSDVAVGFDINGGVQCAPACP